MGEISSEEFSNRRLKNDRRERPTPLFNRHFLWGRRRGFRRAAEASQAYMDRPGTGWILLAIIVLVAGVADAWLTHFGMTQQITREANPVIRGLYDRIGPELTWTFKIGITLIGAWALLAHRRWPLATVGLVMLALYYLTIFAMHVAGLGVAIIPL